MTDRTADPVLNYLDRFQSQMSRFENRFGNVAAEMRTGKKLMAALRQSEATQPADIASLKSRLDRIERRPVFAV